MTGTRAGALLLTLALVAWSAPTALAHGHDDLPPCEAITENPSEIENYYLRTGGGSAEVWEETNEVPGLQTQDCYTGDEEFDNIESHASDSHEATIPADAVNAVELIRDTVVDLVPDPVELCQELVNTLTGQTCSF